MDISCLCCLLSTMRTWPLEITPVHRGYVLEAGHSLWTTYVQTLRVADISHLLFKSTTGISFLVVLEVWFRPALRILFCLGTVPCFDLVDFRLMFPPRYRYLPSLSSWFTLCQVTMCRVIKASLHEEIWRFRPSSKCSPSERQLPSSPLSPLPSPLPSLPYPKRYTPAE